MGRAHQFRDNNHLYFITFTVIGWIDIFTRNEYKNILLDSWRFCQETKDLDIYGWVIMTNHVHMIIGSRGRPMDKIVGEMKSFTSRKLRIAIESHPRESRREWMQKAMITAGLDDPRNKDWKLWQEHSHPIEIYSMDFFMQKLEYIHKNPVKAGFVEKPEDWIYSSAGDFCGKKGLIKLTHIYLTESESDAAKAKF